MSPTLPASDFSPMMQHCRNVPSCVRNAAGGGCRMRSVSTFFLHQGWPKCSKRMLPLCVCLQSEEKSVCTVFHFQHFLFYDIFIIDSLTVCRAAVKISQISLRACDAVRKIKLECELANKFAVIHL